MKNSLRYFSIVSTFACAVSALYSLFISASKVLFIWLLLTYLSIALNQLIVLLFSRSLIPRLISMLSSFSLLSISTVSCIIGSIYYLYISPIDYSNYQLLSEIIYLQVSCLISAISSADFILKYREPVEEPELMQDYK